MLIGGLQKTSLLDYPDRVAAVVFTCGCNFACAFCHNPQLVVNAKPTMSEDEFFEFLAKRRKYLDGVVVTGGEPTIHKDLAAFIRKIKDMGFLVKLDTNGTNPNVLKGLIKNDLLDYIAMDVKGPLSMYEAITGRPAEGVKESIGIIMSSGVDYEFRTTVYPKLNKEDFLELFQMIKGAKRYALQQFQPARTLKKEGLTPLSIDELAEIEAMAKEFVQEVIVRNA